MKTVDDTIELPVYVQGDLTKVAGKATYNTKTMEILLDVDWPYWRWSIAPCWKQLSQEQESGVRHREIIKLVGLMLVPKYHDVLT